MQENSYKDFCKEAFNIDIETIKENSYVDVSEKKIKIKSFNTETESVEYNFVNKVVRKSDEAPYLLSTLKNTIQITENHKFYCRINNGTSTYLFVKDIYESFKNGNNIFILNGKKEYELITHLGKEKEKIKIYDLEVDKVHNYFTENLLSHNTYVPMKTTPGGNGVRFYASMRFEISKSQVKDGTDVIGVTLKVKCVKNKLAIPYLITEVEAIYGIGIDVQKDLINECSEIGIISKAGAGWFEIAGQKMQGLDKVKQFLIDNPEYEEELINKLKEKSG